MKLTSQWVVGFVESGGCFHVGFTKQIKPEFAVIEHTCNIKVLYALKSFFGCGIVRRKNADLYVYRVRNQSHLREKIIPFFEKNQLKTFKKVDFIRFRWILIQLERGNHLTDEGLKWILRVKDLMNRD